MSKQKILFTGGGSAGHVTPNLALIEKFKQQGWDVVYIGSTNGIEANLVSRVGVPFHGISSGKMRRCFSWQNFTDCFRIAWGILQSYHLCRKLKPNVVFSKGGFVSFPVVVGARLNGIPVMVHESDLTPGLANRLVFPFAQLIGFSFAETKKYLKYPHKSLMTGTPLRQQIFSGDAEKGRVFCGFSAEKSVVLIMGGGLGAKRINDVVIEQRTELLKHFQIVHLCGAGKQEKVLEKQSGYVAFEYLHEELYDVLACADVIVSRAGANAIYEFLALNKPFILIPLKKASRGDQLANARYFQEKKLCKVIDEEQLSGEILLENLLQTLEEKENYVRALQNFFSPNGVQLIFESLESLARY